MCQPSDPPIRVPPTRIVYYDTAVLESCTKCATRISCTGDLQGFLPRDAALAPRRFALRAHSCGYLKTYHMIHLNSWAPQLSVKFNLELYVIEDWLAEVAPPPRISKYMWFTVPSPVDPASNRICQLSFL